MVWSAGGLLHAGTEEPVEITQEVWSRADAPQTARAAGSAARSPRACPRRVLIAALVVAGLLLARYGLS